MVKIIGEKLDLGGKAVVELPDGKYVFPKQIEPFSTTANLDSEKYAMIQEGDEANSAISMKQGFNGKNHLETHIEVLNSGLIISKSLDFITHLVNVNNALARKGVLYDANGELIEGKRLADYANILNHDCWVRLNESFEKGQGFLDLNIVYVTGLDENKKPVFKKEPLQSCLEKDCYADLESRNKQGYPTQKSPVQKYEQGKSVYFSHPKENMAVRFDANPDGAGFGCYGNPRVANAGLGVFACAEGAKKI